MSTTTTYQGLGYALAAWLLATNPTLTADQIVFASQPGKQVKRPLPFVTMYFTAFDVQRTVADERVAGLCDAVEVTGGTTGDIYTLSVQGADVTYTRTSTDTDDDVAAALASAIQSDADLWGAVTASSTGAALFVAPRGGVTLDVSTTDPNLSLTADLPYFLTRAYRTAVASISTFGGGAAQILQNARLGLTLPTVQAAIRPYGVWFTHRGTGIRNLTALIDTTFEERALLEVDVCYFVESWVDSALAALHANFHITTNGPDIDLTVELT